MNEEKKESLITVLNVMGLNFRGKRKRIVLFFPGSALTSHKVNTAFEALYNNYNWVPPGQVIGDEYALESVKKIRLSMQLTDRPDEAMICIAAAYPKAYRFNMTEIFH